LAIALYSASVLDRETVGCFLALQDTRLGQDKPQNLQWNADHLGILPNPHRNMHSAPLMLIAEWKCRDAMCPVCTEELALLLPSAHLWVAAKTDMFC
jgi:hypothetical protein